MVDRPIRPLWPKGFRNEVQIIGTVLSIDGEHSHDTLAINGASAALTISPLPFFGPVGAVRIGRIDGQIVVNPLMTQMEDSDLDLIVCGTLDAITMVEAGAKEISEDAMLQAFEAAHAAIKTLCQAQLDLRAKVGQPKWQDAGVQSEIDARYGSPTPASGKGQPEIERGPRVTANVHACPTCCSAASVASKVKRPGPALIGVPLITPLGERLNPSGKLPPASE